MHARIPTYWPCVLMLLVSLAPLAGCTEADTARAATPSPNRLSKDELRDRLDRAIDLCGRRHLVAETNAAWQVVHGILAFGPDLQLDVRGKPTSALKYLQNGGRLTGWVLVPGDKGLESVLEPGSKSGMGHEDQWLGYLSLCGLPEDTPIQVAGNTYTIHDLVTQAQWDIYEGMEATWTLMGFAAYLPIDAKWKARDGSEWTIERVIQMEANQDLNNSACGGTHRLVGMTVALKRYLESGGKLTGGWAAAHNKIYEEAIPMAKAYQNPDGSFSAEYFKGQTPTADIGQRIGTTGHTLEFLVIALPDNEFRDPWVERAATRLCDMIDETKTLSLECGGLYHAARGLKLYRERRFGPQAKSKTPDKAPDDIGPQLGP